MPFRAPACRRAALGSINRESNGRANKLDSQDRAFHDWYRFVLSYPPHLVRDYLEDFGLNGSHTVLDPFCGTGTTLVESRLNGIKAVGLEANPLAHFASSVKLDWDVDPDELEERSQDIAHLAVQKLTEQGIEDNRPFEGKTPDRVLRTLSPEAASLILTELDQPASAAQDLGSLG